MPSSRPLLTSLGGDCQVGWQIRRHVEPIASPFDWIVTPLAALEAILADRGARFARSVSILPAKPPFAAESTVCGDYGCSYHHDFVHDAQGRIVATPEALAGVRAKMLHKWDSFAAAVGRCGEVRFVHLGSFKTPPLAWSYLPEADTLAMSRINRLQRTLAEAFPATRCRLLQVHYPQTTPFHADEPPADLVDVRELPLTPGANWQGDDAAWDRLLGEFAAPAVVPGPAVPGLAHDVAPGLAHDAVPGLAHHPGA